MISRPERLRLILAIVKKDCRIPPWTWVMTVIVAIIPFVFFLSAALSLAAYSNRFGGFQWRWFDSSLRIYYAVSTGLSSLVLGLTFLHFHHGEVQRGTIRSIVLYPVNMNDLTIAKLLSSVVVSAILSTILFLGIFGGFFLVGAFPFGDFLALHVTAFLMSFIALAVGVFLAQGLAQAAGRMVLSPTALGGIFLLLSILFTETGLTVIGVQIASIGHPGRGLSPLEFQGIVNVAQGLSVLSPAHVGARILALGFGITGMWADVHVVIPIAALVVAGGYWLGRRLYLDIFIR